jgi:hypothetical protein
MARGIKTGGGSRKGRPNKRHLDGERYARAIMEDPTVIATLLKQAQDGLMSADLAKTLLSYAYGKPIEVVENGDGDSPRSVTITF